MADEGNLRRWKPGESGNPRGRPKTGRGRGIWSSNAARRLFSECISDEQRRAVSKAVLEVATRPHPPLWALQAVADAAGLDKELLRRTGHLPSGKTYVWV